MKEIETIAYAYALKINVGDLGGYNVTNGQEEESRRNKLRKAFVDGYKYAKEWNKIEDVTPPYFESILVKIRVISISNHSYIDIIGIALLNDKDIWNGNDINYLRGKMSDDMGVHSTWKVIEWREI